MKFPVIVLGIVFVLIATRRIGNVELQIWQIMLFGAIAVLITGQISPVNALLSTDLDVILFIFGMCTQLKIDFALIAFNSKYVEFTT